MPCPRTQQANLPACSPQPLLNAERQAGKLRMPFFKVFWYDSTRGMNPRSTDCEADALTTTPSRRSLQCIWSLLLKKIQLQKRKINNVQSLKDVLTNVWNAISLDIIQRTTQSWLNRLRRCSAVDGKHFEHYR